MSTTEGARDVTLVNPRGSSTLASAFRYYIRPTWASVEAVEPDPSVVLNETIRFVIRSSGYPWRVRDSISGIELVLVPSGTMDMGCSASNLHPCAADESPVHPVTISDFMYVGRTEVTQQQWTAILGTNPSFFQGPSYPDAGGRPVEQVSWNAAQEFLVRTALRLPTEAEWEYLYRSNTSAAYHNWAVMPDGTNSETNLGDIAWFDANNGAAGSATFGTKLVARKFPNAYGLYDMAGNVAEWVSDYYSATYYASSPSLNPAGPASGTGRVYRGGSFAGSSNSLRASRRLASAPDQATHANGFRVVRGLQETPTLARVEPAFGPATGGTTITIRGTNLTGTTGIVVGGLAATS
ncbi:MAG: SUMF1/EgtB/PvdO family nonheme iron enzyme, partial [Phycisphaerales bacterium]